MTVVIWGGEITWTFVYLCFSIPSALWRWTRGGLGDELQVKQRKGKRFAPAW